MPIQFFHQHTVFFRSRTECPVKIRTFFTGSLKLLHPAPVFDFLMVSIQQHFRYLPAFPDLRTGILRILQQSVPVAFPDIALRIRQNARYQAADRIGHSHGGKFSACEDKIAERDFLVHTGFQKAFIHAFVMSADQHQMVVIPLKAPRSLLVKRFSLRREVNHSSSAFPGSLHRCIQAGFQGLCHHDTAKTAAIRVVIHLILTVVSIITDLHAVDFKNFFFACTPQNALVQHCVHMLREQRQYVNSHAYMPSIIRTVTIPASASADSTNAGTAGIRCSFPSASVTT